MKNIFNDNKNKIFAPLGALLIASSVSLSTAVTSFANGGPDDTIESDVTIETNTDIESAATREVTRESDDLKLKIDETIDNEVVNNKEKEDLKDDKGGEKGKKPCFKNDRLKTVGISVLTGAIFGGLGALINHFTDSDSVDSDFKYDFTGKFDSCTITSYDNNTSSLHCE